ncbi:hypothetical protein TorRG33x02_168460 [Trema orientale]|uniref:Uncharacterized protein n=1 Tax=Trema orientale TaxID=63057 RepID=A0A2P5EP87_TREOI|nr:hypothetical protein TorRG33x02_168460 [Trema orientale]
MAMGRFLTVDKLFSLQAVQSGLDTCLLRCWTFTGLLSFHDLEDDNNLCRCQAFICFLNLTSFGNTVGTAYK